jgi:hypothetical protein
MHGTIPLNVAEHSAGTAARWSARAGFKYLHPDQVQRGPLTCIEFWSRTVRKQNGALNRVSGPKPLATFRNWSQVLIAGRAEHLAANDLPRSSIPPGSRSARLAGARLRARQKQLPLAHILRHGCCAPELLVSLVHTPELAQQIAAYARQQVILP